MANAGWAFGGAADSRTVLLCTHSQRWFHDVKQDYRSADEQALRTTTTPQDAALS
jgi:hypothetical protein